MDDIDHCEEYGHLPVPDRSLTAAELLGELIRMFCARCGSPCV